MSRGMWIIEILGEISIKGTYGFGHNWGTISISENSTIDEILQFCNDFKSMYNAIDPKPIETHPPTDEYLSWHRSHQVDPYPYWTNDSGNGFGHGTGGQGGNY